MKEQTPDKIWVIFCLIDRALSSLPPFQHTGFYSFLGLFALRHAWKNTANARIT
jgi:hypothetical protein